MGRWDEEKGRCHVGLSLRWRVCDVLAGLKDVKWHYQFGWFENVEGLKLPRSLFWQGFKRKSGGEKGAVTCQTLFRDIGKLERSSLLGLHKQASKIDW